MKIDCPHCGKKNNVAGAYQRPERGTEGRNDNAATCGWCGKKFPLPPPKEEGR